MAAGLYPDKKCADYKPTTNTGERSKEMKKRMSREEQEKRIEESARLRDEQMRAYIAMADTLKCKVCGNVGGIARLLGGRAVALCIEHVTAWHKVLHAHVLRDQYNDSQAAFYVAIHQSDVEVAMTKNREWQDVSDAIYELSGEWLKEEKMKW